jgi:hypothetical protein
VFVGDTTNEKENPMNQYTTNYPTRTEVRTYEVNGETKSYSVEIITVPVTIEGETRDIEFMRLGDRAKAGSAEVFGCLKGHGTKVHRTAGNIWYSDGEWKFDFRSGYALNSGSCRIIAFADTVEDAAKSQHVGTKFAEEVK